MTPRCVRLLSERCGFFCKPLTFSGLFEGKLKERTRRTRRKSRNRGANFLLVYLVHSFSLFKTVEEGFIRSFNGFLRLYKDFKRSLKRGLLPTRRCEKHCPTIVQGLGHKCRRRLETGQTIHSCTCCIFYYYYYKKVSTQRIFLLRGCIRGTGFVLHFFILLEPYSAICFCLSAEASGHLVWFSNSFRSNGLG